MSDKNQIIRQYAAPQGMLFAATIIGALAYPFWIYVMFKFFSGSWELISGAPVEPPVFGMMSSYHKPAQNGYWFFISSSIVLSILLSLSLPKLIGAPFMKWVFGIRYLNEKGEGIALWQPLAKTGIEIGKFLLLALPGPILGFILGPDIDWLSLVALALGFIAVIYLTFKIDSSGRSLAYKKARIVPVHKNNIAAFREALKNEHAE